MAEVVEERGPSVFDECTPAQLYAIIRDVYTRDDRPWVVGYSGGKDSTTALQLIWAALAELPEDERKKPVYVISSDTLVETPVIVSYIDTTLARINAAAREQKLPFEAHKVQPTVSDSFWVNLIGRGYPAPTNTFRWCTERLKIKPANKFILDRAAEYGEVVVVLGVRKAESATRAQVMSLHKIAGSDLSRHTSLPNAFVFTPIEDFSVNDVWTYLLQVKSPWGNDNRELVTLYRNAAAGECPLVVDNTTSSCGNSRFGCWVCTVVQKDHSMEALIENGEDWMQPLLDLRDWLAATSAPAAKIKYRSFKRRTGKITLDKSTGSPIPGPYKFPVRVDLLRRLLEIEAGFRRAGKEELDTLVSDDELREIRRIWRTEEQDWDDSVVRLLEGMEDRDLDWEVDEYGVFSQRERDLLNETAKDADVSSAMLAKLLDAERQWQGLSRRGGIFKEIDSVLGEDWLSSEDEAGLAEKYLSVRDRATTEDTTEEPTE